MTEVALLAPFSAWSDALSHVPDEAFAAGLLGSGVALDPLEGIVRAPFDGSVIAVAATGHSITVRHDSGAEVLIHVGVDTVDLKGQGFSLKTAMGARVKAGDTLLEFDLDQIVRQARSAITPLILLSDDFCLKNLVLGKIVAAGDAIGTISGGTPQRTVPAAAAEAGKSASCVLRVPLANGLHARPSGRVAALLKSYVADVSFGKGERTANARSITAILKLDIRKDEEISIEASGTDAEETLEAVASLILSGMGEAEHSFPALEEPRRLDTLKSASDAPGGSDIHGVRAAPGGVLGTIFQFGQRDDVPVPDRRGPPPEEQRSLDLVIEALGAELRHLAARSDIGEAHLAILNDPAIIGAVRNRIEEGQSAPAAWRAVTRDEIAALKATGNALLMERSADYIDVERQVVAHLLGDVAEHVTLPEGAILIADELLPSEFLKLDLTHLAAIVTAGGGPTSHVAILAASNSIPMLVSCGQSVLDIADGAPAILPFAGAELLVEPDPVQRSTFLAEAAVREEKRSIDALSAEQDCVMADGKRIEVYANCGSASDAAQAVANGAEGCGLLRTEFLFLDRHQPPTREEQAATYGEIAEAMAGRPLIVRTLDAGSDKPLAYLPMPLEENPALGARGIRLSLARPDLLEEQFHAILVSVPTQQVRIMLPMIVDLSELKEARRLLRQVEARLGITEPTPLGIMVETPAAALLAERLAGEADFLSVGSNDLTQYTLAADRQNPVVASAADALHPAVLRLVKFAADGAHVHGRWLGVCGGIASDPDAAALLIGLGVDELSATPTMIPSIKARIRTLRFEDCRRLAETALGQASAQDVRGLIGEVRHAAAL